MIGDGPLGDKVARFARENSDRLTDLGRRNDIAAWMASASMLLLPSRYEGMANAALEAMASGLPVAATDVEGTRELLGPAAEQQSVAADDEIGWRKLVCRLANDRALRGGLGQANFARCCDSLRLRDRLQENERVLQNLGSAGSAR